MEAVGLINLQDLTNSYRLYGVCNSCHRMGSLNKPQLVALLGRACPISRVRTKLRCYACESKDCGIRIV